MGIYDEARNDAMSNEGRYSAHVCGQFPGVIEAVKATTWQGRDLFEIKAKTQYGSARMTVWRTTEKDDLPRAIERAKGDQAEGVKAIKKIWSRTGRIYHDLGLEIPMNETALYDDLGKLVGRECWIVVKENKQDAQNPYVYINAPKKNGQAKLDGPAPMTSTSAAPTSSNGSYVPEAPGLDEVPF
jgi:hypothetical protein